MNNVFENNGVTFGTKHSYRDFGLFPLEGAGISAPDVDEKFVKIPGSPKLLDLTEALIGHPQYYGRTGKFPFKIIGSNDYCETIYSQVMGYIHGKRLTVIKDDEKAYMYIGRLKVGQLTKQGGQARFEITGTFDPYKIELTNTTEPWIWDTFNFSDGVIREYSNLPISGTKQAVIIGSVMPITPLFIVDSSDGTGMKLTIENETYNLKDGENLIAEIVLKNRDYVMIFEGEGTVSVEFKVGAM